MPSARHPFSLLAPVALAAVALLAGAVLAGLGTDSLRTAAYWALLALLAGGAVWAAVWAARHDELLGPVGIAALCVLFYFVMRPAQLGFSASELQHDAYDYFAGPLQSVLDLTAQEITLYVNTRLLEPFDLAMTRTLGLLVVFFGLFAAGYRLGLGRRLAAAAARLGRSAGDPAARWVMVAWLVVGLGGQALVLVSIGGVNSVYSKLGTQGNLAVSFGSLVLMNFYLAGLLLWVCLETPCTRATRIAFALAVAEYAGFLGMLGSRTLVLVPVVVCLLAYNELGGRVRLRVLVPCTIVALLFAGAYLCVREGSSGRPFNEVVKDVPRYAVDVRSVLNSSPVYDQLLEEVDYIPSRAGFRHGGELAQGVLGQIPRFVYPVKPEATDTTFRRLIWGEYFLAGRPTGAAGEFYRDFGFVGAAVGALLLGLLARGLTGLRARAGGPAGRQVRVIGYVVGCLFLYQALVGSWSVVLGSALELGIPLGLALGLTLRRA